MAGSGVTRRGVMVGAAAVVLPVPALAGAGPALADTPITAEAAIAEAFRARDQAVSAGDQAYGAVVVFDGRIVGFGPSRVVQDGDPDAHAERVALRDAQARLGRTDLAGAVIYSSSRPCALCQRALAAAGVARMIHGRERTDAGAPRGDGS